MSEVSRVQCHLQKNPFIVVNRQKLKAPLGDFPTFGNVLGNRGVDSHDWRERQVLNQPGIPEAGVLGSRERFERSRPPQGPLA